MLPLTADIVFSCSPPFLSITKKLSPTTPTVVLVLSSTTKTVGLVTDFILPLALKLSFNLSAILIIIKGSNIEAASKEH